MNTRTLLVAVVLAVPGHALAEDPKLEAKQHIDRATQLHKEGKLADVLAELKTAYALDPQPSLLFAMGQVHVQLGQCAQAVTYYERFLATKPAAELAAVTNEAIETCKTNPPPVVEPPKPDPIEVAPPPPPPEVIPTPRVEAMPPPVATAQPRPSRWYTDYLGDGIVAAGVISGAAGVLLYRSALADLDRAGAATSYQAFSSLVDRASSKRTDAVICGAASVALVAVGAFKLVRHHGDRDVAVVVQPSGIAFVWGGSL
jgi:hypothetical protein